MDQEMMIFEDRADAGRRLAKALAKYAKRDDVIVLGIPRGGVPVAYEIAQALALPLDVFIAHKLGVPGQEELAFGAVAIGGTRVLDQEIIDSVGVSQEQIEGVAKKMEAQLKLRENLYRAGRPPLQLEGVTVILVDDGIATGSSTLVAIRALRQLKPARIVVAAPVAPVSTRNRLRPLVDDFVCLLTPEHFFAIGQFYLDFSQVADDEVIDFLQKAERPAAKKPVLQ